MQLKKGKILVLNSGSSSLKFKLFQNKKNPEEIASGLVDKIGKKESEVIIDAQNDFTKKIKVKNHKEAIKWTLESLKELQIIKNFNEISIVGHRVVHGGEQFHKPTIITESFLKKIEKLNHLAPLHNPANILGIKSAREALKEAKQVAIFDTAYHQSLPKKAFLYAIPTKFYKKFGIRKYGFHGTSHKYLAKEASKILKKKNLKVITCHLGNGSSICASVKGESKETSMGFTPLAGLPMGTRSGDIDASIPLFLEQNAHLKTKEIEEILLKNSGLKAISEISSDMREIYAKSLKKDEKAIFTLEYLAYKIAQICASYHVSIGGADAIVFSGGMGIHVHYIRDKVFSYLKILGFELDPRKNKSYQTIISKKHSPRKILIIKTNEELQIALEAKELLEK